MEQKELGKLEEILKSDKKLEAEPTKNTLIPTHPPLNKEGV
jgi:hypothetical protein